MRTNHRTLPVLFMSVALIAVVNAFAHAPPTRANPAQLLRQAVRELTAEAERAQRDGRLPRNEADYASTFLGDRAIESLPGDVVWSTLRRPVGRDPFIDAYVRWQLTGFSPGIPDASSLPQQEFERFLADLPGFLPNPRSDAALLRRVNAALSVPDLSDTDIEAIAGLNRQLTETTRSTQLMNAPASRLREWIEREVGEEGGRAQFVRLERIASMVASGWNVDALKRRLEQALQASADDASFTPELRRRFAAAAVRLAGTRIAILESVRTIERTAQAQFDSAAVYDFEVRSWIRALQLGPGE